MLSKFLKEHKIDLEGALRQQDKDHSGNLQHEEVKLAFKEAGLRLTNVRLCLNTILLLVYFMNISSDLRIFFTTTLQRQIDTLVEEIDVTHSGSIKWE